MGAWSGSRLRDVVAFFMTGILGYVGALFLQSGPWTPYAPILLSYHFFLLWLVLTQENERGFSLSLPSMLVTHSAFLAVVVAVGMNHGVPYLAIFRMILLPLAVFERYWLFDGRERKRKHSRVEAGSFAVTGSGEEYKEWLAYLATHRSLASKPDSSLQDQYEKWLLRRSKRSPLWDKA